MNALGYALVFGTLVGFIALLVLWLVAENRWSKRSRITLGLLTILIPRVVKKLRRPKNVENRGTFRLLPCTDFGRTSAQVNAGQSIQNAKPALRGREAYVVTTPAR